MEARPTGIPAKSAHAMHRVGARAISCSWQAVPTVLVGVELQADEPHPQSAQAMDEVRIRAQTGAGIC